MFNHLRNCQLFSIVAAQFYIPTSSLWGFWFLHILYQHLLLTAFFIIDILVGVKWYLIVLSVYVLLMTKHVEHLFMCLLAICIPPLENCLFRSLVHFYIDLLVFFFPFKKLFIYLFLAALGLCCCVRAFSSCGEWGLFFVEVRRLLIAMASLVAEHRL